MNWYYGPSDYQILNNYDRNLDEIMPFGLGNLWMDQQVRIHSFLRFLSHHYLPS